MLVLQENPDFFENMIENNKRIDVEDLKELRNWALKRKRRSSTFIIKEKQFKRSNSFRIIEKNREEIKLLKVFRNVWGDKEKTSLTRENSLKNQENHAKKNEIFNDFNENLRFFSLFLAE